MSKTLETLAMGLGTTELLIILGILTLLFGASRIPALARSMGSGIRNFQGALKGDETAKNIESTPAVNLPAATATTDHQSQA